MRKYLRDLAKKTYYVITGPQIRRRRAYRDSMPEVQLSVHHTGSCIVLPHRRALLESMPSGGNVMELGVADGAFSTEILELARPRQLHLVDAWHAIDYRSDYGTVLSRFKSEMESGLVKVQRGFSTDVLPAFEDAGLDWIYIDTNHSYETTAAELLLAERAVRAGGLIAGHDYCVGNIMKPAVFGVIQAVNEFCVNRGWRFKFITLESHGHFSFCLEKAMAPQGA